jgi:hypothetical protein
MQQLIQLGTETLAVLVLQTKCELYEALKREQTNEKAIRGFRNENVLMAGFIDSGNGLRKGEYMEWRGAQLKRLMAQPAE